MRRPGFQAVFFDLDGTLIDTEPTAARAIRTSFSRWGIRLDPQDSQYVTGRTWDSAFSFLFEKYRPNVSRKAAEKEVLGAYREALRNELVVVPGGVSSVRALAKGYSLGLVSGSHRSEILWALDQLGIADHFQVILGAEDYSRSKPAPDGYLAAIGQLNAKAHHCLVFEDSQAGVDSARAAGAWVVAITGTNHFQQDLSRAHGRIHDLREVTADWVDDLAEKFLSSAPFTRES